MSDCVQEEDSIPSWLRPLLCLLLICFSGMFSGLTLGLMGLDKTQLRVIKESGTDQMKAYAEKIEPLRRNGNHLLSTLLLGNTAVNAALATRMVTPQNTTGVSVYRVSLPLFLLGKPTAGGVPRVNSNTRRRV